MLEPLAGALLGALPAPSAGALLLAFAFDRWVGELPARIHPVVWLGALIAKLRARAPTTPPLPALAVGGVIALSLPVASGALGWGFMHAVEGLAAAPLLEGLVLTGTFAVRGLGEASLAVGRALEAGDLPSARARLRCLCSRPAGALGAPELAAAAIESAAENTSDSVIAPLVYYAAFGLPGALAYRAVNTLDAMLGYRGPLRYLGRVAARQDDVANLLPARLTALLLWVSAGRHLRRGAGAWWRDARATESPNAGHPMAMMAGLLGVELRKPGAYRLGRGLPEPTGADIARAWRIADRACWLGLGLALLVCGWRA